jgi:hypothetical protein
MSTTPENFINANYANARSPNLLLTIDGVTTIYSIASAYTDEIVYGSPVVYGTPGLYYGLPYTQEVSSVKRYISDESSMVISQKIEPEQGRGSTSELTIVLIDKNQEITNLVSPGKVIPDILNSECRLWFGYQNTNFPDDHFVIYQGYITNVVTQAGKIRLSISDATQKKRQAINQAFKSTLFLPMTSTDLFFSPATTGQIFENYPVLNIYGAFDSYVGLYFRIGDEFILLDPSAVSYGSDTVQPRSVVLLSRGQRTTVAADHSAITVVRESGALVAGRYIDLQLNGVSFAALLPEGSYNLGITQPLLNKQFWTELQEVIQAAWAAAGGNAAYQFKVKYWAGDLTTPPSESINNFLFLGSNPNAYKFSVSVNSANPVSYPISDFRILWNSGANASNNLRELMGFNNADYIGGIEYISPNWIEMEGVDVTQSLSITGHPIDVALTVMMSGGGGPFATDVTCIGIGTADGVSASSYSILLPTGVDAVRDYGLTAGTYNPVDIGKSGDQVTISGSTTASNNQSCIITDILPGPSNDNQVLVVSVPSAPFSLAFDTNTSLRLAFRSKYDRLPYGVGLKIPPKFVDVAGHEALRDIYLSDSGYQVSCLLQTQQVGKDFIEAQCYLPFGLYAVTKRGQLSVSLTRPPIPGTIPVQLDSTNILNPQNITVTRGLNNRRFFNQVQYQYDKTDDGRFQSVYRAIDSISLTKFDLQTILPISADGVYTTINGANTGSITVIEDTAQRFLTRFADVAYEIRLQVNLEAGAQIEAGDIVKLVDDGSLGISNMASGERNMGTVLMEVIDRSLDVKGGICNLSLLSNVGFTTNDRFGGIAPSSYVDDSPFNPSPTASEFSIIYSFGGVFGPNEYKKWKDYIGEEIIVHNSDYTLSGTSVLQSVVAPNGTTIAYGGRLYIDPPLSFIPTADCVVEIANYGTSLPGTRQDEYSKTVHAFLNPEISVTSGTSSTVFTVSSADASTYLFVGSYIYLHDDTYTRLSQSVQITNISTVGLVSTITVASSLGFTPQVNDSVELIGFKVDTSNGYVFS